MPQRKVQPDTQTLDRAVLEEFMSALGPRGLGVLQGVAALFFTETPVLLAELAKAVAAENFARATALAHRLRGSSMSLGANALSTRCAELEADEPKAADELLRAIVAEYEQAAIAIAAFLEARKKEGQAGQRPS